jgi:hypothetical protein
VRVEDEELALSQLPGVVDPHNTVGVLSTAVHYRTAYLLEMLPKHLAVLDDVLPIGYVHYSAVIVAQLFDHPRYLCRPDPLSASLESLVAA